MHAHTYETLNYLKIQKKDRDDPNVIEKKCNIHV